MSRAPKCRAAPAPPRSHTFLISPEARPCNFTPIPARLPPSPPARPTAATRHGIAPSPRGRPLRGRALPDDGGRRHPPLARPRRTGASRSAAPSAPQHPRSNPEAYHSGWQYSVHLNREEPYRRDGTAQSAPNEDRPNVTARKHDCVLSCVRCNLASGYEQGRMSVDAPGAEAITGHKTALSACRRPLQRTHRLRTLPIPHEKPSSGKHGTQHH